MKCFEDEPLRDEKGEALQKSPSNQKQYWSEYIKKDPCFLSETDHPFSDDVTQYSLSLCTELEGTAVLEVGCGDGKDIIGMVRKYGASRATAIDISEKRVRLALENVKNASLSDSVHVIQMDANQLGFPNQFFDVVFCNSVLLFLDPERFFPEASRVLKSRGRLFLFAESLPLNPFLRAYRAYCKNPNKRAIERFAKRSTVRQIREIADGWFTSVKHREFYIFFYILCRHWPSLVRLLSFGQIRVGASRCKLCQVLDGVLLRMFPFLRQFAWMTVQVFTK